MDLKKFDINKLRTLISQQICQITCIECCKYLTVPTSASCGHVLCQTCWIGRHVCPYCRKKCDKNKMKLNVPLLNLTKNVLLLGKTFAELFKIELEQFLSNSPDHIDLQRDPNKNIKEWLTSTQNNFSEPSLKSTEESLHVKQITCQVQVHTENKKKAVPYEIKYAPQNQCAWDKIEEMTEIDTLPTHNKENIVGPMDIESFDFVIDENEFSPKKPRRSFRNKEIQNSNITKSSNEIISNKIDCQTLDSADTNKTSHKTGKSWSNVKRMKKEFSKLNKQKRNKLNVSIEMCKKTQPTSIKVMETVTSQPTAYSIDDNTPNVTGKKCDSNIKISKNNTPTVCFFKKSTLHHTNNYINTKNDLGGMKNLNTNNKDDIQITIKVGQTLTNIVIKKKDNDVELNVQTDGEIKKSSHNEKSIIKNFSVSNKVQNINEENGNMKDLSNKVFIPLQRTFTNSLHNKVVENSVSTKKNTESADTTTAQLEITASVEKELSRSMENIDFQYNIKRPESIKINEDFPIEKSNKVVREIVHAAEYLKDIDMFDSESVKEGNVQLLKATNSTQSAVFMPTCKNSTQKKTEKRNRDKEEDNELPINKKANLKRANINARGVIDENNLTEAALERKKMVECNELSNCDLNISQEYPYIERNRNNCLTVKTQQQNNDSRVLRNSRGNKDMYANIDSDMNEKYSENVFSFIDGNGDMDGDDGANDNVDRQARQLKTPRNEEKDRNIELQSELYNKDKTCPRDELDVVMQATPLQNDVDSDHSVVEETPQKSSSFAKVRNKSEGLNSSIKASKRKAQPPSRGAQAEESAMDEDLSIISLPNTLIESSQSKTVINKVPPGTRLETPVTINKFVDQIKYNSTPVAKKSLNFDSQNIEDHEQTYCSSSSTTAKNTQEKEFMSKAKAFEQSYSPSRTLRSMAAKKHLKYCVVGSCLTLQELNNVKKLCSLNDWTYADNYTRDVTHLVVGVDANNRSQRSVKYMCALAASKWIVSYAWVAKCLLVTDVVDEKPFEVLDGMGEPGPRRSRVATAKLFQGITFYCMPPFNILKEDILQEILCAAGGVVVAEPQELRAAVGPALLLAEPEHTQEDRFMYLAMKMSVVPVNYEWVLNCLGSYTIRSIYDLLLCPATLLTSIIENWPLELIAQTDDD